MADYSNSKDLESKEYSNMKEHSLVTLGKDRFLHPEDNSVHLVDDEEANTFLNDLTNYPHAYVLACLMDRQIKAERAWIIPWTIKNDLNSFDIRDSLRIISVVDQFEVPVRNGALISQHLHIYNPLPEISSVQNYRDLLHPVGLPQSQGVKTSHQACRNHLER